MFSQRGTGRRNVTIELEKRAASGRSFLIIDNDQSDA